jgi:hypothetical protein
MSDQLNGPCCVLCAAMNYKDVPDRRDKSANALFEAVFAVIGALGFVALFIL